MAGAFGGGRLCPRPDVALGLYDARVPAARTARPLQSCPPCRRHWAGSAGICHTTVENSGFANIPPTKTCMNCHSQIWSTAPTLEPVRASFRTDNRSAGPACTTCPTTSTSTTAFTWTRAWAARPVTAASTDAAHLAGDFAADGVVPELPSRTREYVRPSEVDLPRWVPAATAIRTTRRRAGRGIQDSRCATLTSCSTCHR